MSLGTLTLACWLMVPGAPPGDVSYFNKPNFKIPLQIDPARRSEIKELNLCVSTDQGATYRKEAVAGPEQDGFPFYAEKDGQYWFAVVVVDPQGKQLPADPRDAKPAQKIVVDTKAPSLRIVSAERQGEDVVVSWDAQDENLDLASLKVDWRPADATEMAQWYSAPLLNPTANGQARFRATTSKPLTVRVQVQDLAQNPATAQKDVPAASVGVVSAAQPGTLPPISARPALPPMDAGPPPARMPGYPGDSSTAGRTDGWTPPPSQFPPTAVNPYPPSQFPPTPVSQYVPPPPPPPPPTGPITRVVATANMGPYPASAVMPLGSLPPTSSGPAMQITNKKQFALDYEVTEGGRSKLGAVELWVTQDNGQSWRFLCDDPDLVSPILVELPKEGIYGLRLVLRSAAGLSYGPPQPGDTPEMLVEIDRTPPEAQLMEPIPDPQRPNTLVITWKAKDTVQLAPNPVSLGWSELPGGPWNPIGPVAMPNTGRFDWQLPENLPHHVYMRLMVRDTAGNVSEAITREPVLVDLSKPKGVIKGFAATDGGHHP